MSCDFDQPDRTCPCCGIQAPARDWQHNCRSENRPRQQPSALARLTGFTRAAIEHVLAGCPTCSQEQIDQRLALCRSCEHFRTSRRRPEVGSCSLCGCSLSGYLNKLAWAEQQCPAGKWPCVAGQVQTVQASQQDALGG